MPIDVKGMIEDRRARARAEKAAQEEKIKAIQQKRRERFHLEWQDKLIKLADSSTGRVQFMNGKLSYDPGSETDFEYTDMWNAYTQEANRSNVTVSKETFDSFYDTFMLAKQNLFLQSLAYAQDTGATNKQFKALFNESDFFKKEFFNIKSQLPNTEEGMLADQRMSEMMPDRYEMQHGDTWKATGARAMDWAKENPYWTAGGAAAGLWGMKKFGPNMIDKMKGVWTGGLGTGAQSGLFKYGGAGPIGTAIGVGTGIKALGPMAGLSEGQSRGLGNIAQAGIGGGYLYSGVNPQYQQALRNKLISNLQSTTGGKAALLKNARALNVKVPDSVLRKNASKKSIDALRAKTVTKAKSLITKQGSSKILQSGLSKFATKGVTKAGQNIIGKTLLRGFGPAGMLLSTAWSLYDLYNYGFGDKESAPAQPAEDVVSVDEYNKMFGTDY